MNSPDRVLLNLALLLTAGSALAQSGDISSISFDVLPDGTHMLAGAITLDGEVHVNGGLASAGHLSTASGIIFPDGSVQTTAVDAAVVRSFSANNGLYSNRITDMTPPNPYTEICFKGGSMLADIHVVSEDPTGGQCEPGDTGWIVERDERPGGAVAWDEARAQCLLSGMRLLEPFEYRVSCRNAGPFGINDMVDDYEYSSNSAQFSPTSPGSISTGILGGGSCDFGTLRFVANSTGGSDTASYRCAL